MKKTEDKMRKAVLLVYPDAEVIIEQLEIENGYDPCMLRIPTIVIIRPWKQKLMYDRIKQAVWLLNRTKCFSRILFTVQTMTRQEWASRRY